MPTLTYRGKKYVQNKAAAPQQFVELTYRRSIYSTRREEILKDHPILNYRGVDYQK